MDKKNLYKHSENIAFRYYSYYTRHFEKLGYTLEDLKQEARITTLEMITKYKCKDEKELKKLINKATGWRFGELLRNRTNGDKVENVLSFDELCYIPTKRLGGKPETLFILLKSKCTEEEYAILTKKFKENKPHTQIAKEIGLTSAGVGFILNNLYMKIKKLFKNKDFTLFF